MKKLYEKMSIIQGLHVPMTGKAHHGKFASINDIMGKLDPLLKEHSLLLYHVSKDGYVETHIVDIEEDSVVRSSFKLPELSDMQKMGGAITYAKRYNISQIFNIIANEDKDGYDVVSKDVPKKRLSPAELDMVVIDQLHKEKESGIKHKFDEVIKRLEKVYKINDSQKETIKQFINK